MAKTRAPALRQRVSIRPVGIRTVSLRFRRTEQACSKRPKTTDKLKELVDDDKVIFLPNVLCFLTFTSQPCTQASTRPLDNANDLQQDQQRVHTDQRPENDEKQQQEKERQREEEREDASLWALFDDWEWDDAVLRQLP